MLKKLILIFILIIFSSLCLKFAFSAQKYTAEQTLAADCAEGLDKLEAKIDGLNNELKNSNKEILRKLDLILSNQEKIFQELAIIKVRASKR
ncbi:MAG: hypothetical protein A3J51_06500 [Omnitrophica WOR_2 bacterium RIFCSPHIGHO2_02_FULL_45_21]|nr:MAG: hypothetical protein A3J51_06500 [Omnitrophica WOR_2 bacterium RIFCSPHIGHO2_02_FULL_45_21]